MIIHTTGTLLIFLSFCLFQFFLYCSAAILLYVVAVKIIDSLTAYCSAVLKTKQTKQNWNNSTRLLAWEQSQMWNFIPFCCCCCCFMENGNELSRKCMHIVIFFFFNLSADFDRHKEHSEGNQQFVRKAWQNIHRHRWTYIQGKKLGIQGDHALKA